MAAVAATVASSAPRAGPWSTARGATAASRTPAWTGAVRSAAREAAARPATELSPGLCATSRVRLPPVESLRLWPGSSFSLRPVVRSGFVLARASAGPADGTIRGDVGHLEQVRSWFGRPLWAMEPADADAYFGKALRASPSGTRLARSQPLTTHSTYPELRHRAELHRRLLVPGRCWRVAQWARGGGQGPPSELGRRLTPHVLRRFRASQLHQIGLDLVSMVSMVSIQEALGAFVDRHDDAARTRPADPGGRPGRRLRRSGP